ncbi:BMP family ABC transporter substrate-binding protein [Salipiger sp. IMCC34102]|uniref:BMP family lipoprotein n=1 Tax=Salipiger sp. IMCC34102 TaxID=2510647 RepID=UPI00101BB4A3|nr:BMP family ABC transporter substrate-binding protein [Salipiger sp. IMCC34102]RYH03837.1 BMP family ABC transporter substrate-binding protein [Salipiger sp. IMCC34102]
MSIMHKLFGATAALALTAGAAAADPAIVFDLGGKFDKSFNESAFNGATRWAEETGGTFAEVELQSDAQREQALRRFAESGANPIVMAGFSFATPLGDIAGDYPDTKFVIIDAVVEAPNVKSVVFNEEQGSYLVGMMAAMASETGTVSFVGGMDIPLIRKFGCGYAQGAMAADPEVEVIANMTGTTPAAWNDPVKGTELVLAQKSQGSDVVFHAAGGTGVGVLQAAADNDMLGIGVDANQNYTHPGSVLTSMVKRVDNVVYDAFTAGEAVEPGIASLGLADDGVSAAMDEYNEELVTAEMMTAIEEATQQIIDGEIEVHDYMSDESCPSLSF